jgi:DNA replication protein DnaC
VTGPAPALAPDLHAGLRRLKLAAMRTLAPELLVTAKTQRWAPEELLRTLVEAEICARDASNARHRLKAAAFPVVKTLEEFVAAAYERRALGVGSHWPFDQWGRFLPEHTTAVSLLDRLLHHSIVVVTEGESFRMRQARSQGGTRMKKT